MFTIILFRYYSDITHIFFFHLYSINLILNWNTRTIYSLRVCLVLLFKEEQFLKSLAHASKQTIALNHGTLRSVAGLDFQFICHVSRRERERSDQRFTPRHRIPQESDKRREIFRLSFPARVSFTKRISARREPIIISTR